MMPGMMQNISFVKMKYVCLQIKDRKYLISAAEIAAEYASKAASEVVQSAANDVYFSHFLLCYECNSRLISALDKLAGSIEWITAHARMYSTDAPLTYDDVYKNWNSIQKKIISQKVHPFVEKAKNLAAEDA